VSLSDCLCVCLCVCQYVGPGADNKCDSACTGMCVCQSLHRGVLAQIIRRWRVNRDAAPRSVVRPRNEGVRCVAAEPRRVLKVDMCWKWTATCPHASRAVSGFVTAVYTPPPHRCPVTWASPAVRAQARGEYRMSQLSDKRTCRSWVGRMSGTHIRGSRDDS